MEKAVYKYYRKNGQICVYYKGSYYHFKTVYNMKKFWGCNLNICHASLATVDDVIVNVKRECQHPPLTHRSSLYSDTPVTAKDIVDYRLARIKSSASRKKTKVHKASLKIQNGGEDTQTKEDDEGSVTKTKTSDSSLCQKPTMAVKASKPRIKVSLLVGKKTSKLAKGKSSKLTEKKILNLAKKKTSNLTKKKKTTSTGKKTTGDVEKNTSNLAENTTNLKGKKATNLTGKKTSDVEKTTNITGKKTATLTGKKGSNLTRKKTTDLARKKISNKSSKERTRVTATSKESKSSSMIPLNAMASYLYQLSNAIQVQTKERHAGRTSATNTPQAIRRSRANRGDDAAEFPGTSAGGGGGGMGLEDTTSPPEHFLNDSMAPTPQHPIPPPASNRPESYKLCHNNHLSLVLEALAADESFMDVTLTAQGKSLKAHKSVLSAVSPYFRGVLKDNPCQHPIIIMPRDVKYDELNNIISYIYRGEMTVATEDLPSLLKTAEILQVTGLSPSESMPGVGGLNDTMSSAMQSPVPRTPQHKGHQANKHTSASSIQSLDSTSNSDIIVPADFMDVNLTCVKEEIANLEETTINNTDEDNTTTNTNTENNDDSIIEDDDDDGGDDPVENHRPPAKRRRTNPKSPDTNDTTTTNNTDADPKPNQCPYCETSPKDYNAIMDHMKEKHSNKKPFICSNCCRIYIKNDPYSEHVKACPKAST